jgi:hypothetical protein
MGRVGISTQPPIAQLIDRPSKFVSLRKYGEPRIFADRVLALERVAREFFTRRPSQDVEGDFFSLIDRIKKFSDRRNEIAHSILTQLQWIHPKISMYLPVRDNPGEFALVPALYAHRKLDERHLPKYIYTANELMRFALAFRELSGAAIRLKLQIARIRQS